MSIPRRPATLKAVSKFLFLLITVEIVACYLTLAIFGIRAVIYPAAAYVLTMVLAIPIAIVQEEKE